MLVFLCGCMSVCVSAALYPTIISLNVGPLSQNFIMKIAGHTICIVGKYNGNSSKDKIKVVEIVKHM